MTTLDLQVGVSGNDAVWSDYGGFGFFDESLNSIYFGYYNLTYGSTNCFMRYTNVTIPQGATISAAYLTHKCYNSLSTTTVNGKISAVDEDNATAPTDYASAEAKTRTTASVNWNNVAAWTADANYQSPSIVTVIQEIVNRVGWASGNALIIYIEDNSSTESNNTIRSSYAYDANYNPAESVILHIEYSTEPTPNADKTYAETITMRDISSTIGGDPTEVRNHPHTAKWYMAVEVPRLIWKGRVANDRGYNESGDLEEDLKINMSSGANVGSYVVTNYLPDLTGWCGTTDGGKEHGKFRLRSFDGSNLVVAADMTCVWKTGDYITITDLHEFWPMLHKTEKSGGEIVVYKDHDLDAATYKAEEPVPIMGPPACEFIDAGTGLATVKFHGGSSYVVQPNSTEDYWVNHNGISAYAWWFEGGTPSTAATSSATVTYNTAGRYVARLTLTGENSKTYVSFRNVFIFNRTGAGSPVTEYLPTSVTARLSNHGWEAELEAVEDSFNPAILPDDAQVVLFTEEWFNGVAKTTQLGTFRDRENIKFVGWVWNVRAEYSEGKVRNATVSLRGLQEHLTKQMNFPIYFTMIEDDPPGWSDFSATGLTVRKVLYHLVRWHYTLMRFTDYFIPDDHNNYLPGQNFDQGTLGDALDEFAKDIQSEWAVDRGGALHVFSWYNYLPVSGAGTGWRTRNYLPIAWDENDFSSLSVSPKSKSKVAQVSVEGVECTDAGNYTWTIDLAPGNIKNYGGPTITLGNQVLGTGGVEGTQGWELARSVYAEESRSIESITLQMLGNYSMMDIVPETSYFTLTVTPSSVLRNISWSAKPFWVTGMTITPDCACGDIETEIEAMPETWPDPSTQIYTDRDDVENEPWEAPEGASYSFTNMVKDIITKMPTVVPALLGDGGSNVAGKQTGTSYARLWGDTNAIIVAQNRLLHNIANRPVWIQRNPPTGVQGRQTAMPQYLVLGPRVASDATADSTADRTFTQHHAVFCPSSVTAVVSGYSAPSFVDRRYDYVVKSMSGHLQTAGSTTTTIVVYKNGVQVGTFNMTAGMTDTGKVTLAQTSTDGDYWDIAITAAGIGALGLSVQIEMWRYGV